MRQQPATKEALPKPDQDFLQSLKLLSVHYLFICSVKKYFGFLRGALHIPLKPVLIILSGQRPACLFSLGCSLIPLCVPLVCGGAAVDLARVFYDPCHPARSCDCSVTFLDLNLLLVFFSQHYRAAEPIHTDVLISFSPSRIYRVK